MADRPRHVELEYRFDRLGDEKLAQAYRALVPEGEGAWKLKGVACSLKGDFRDEASGDLRARFLRAAKRRADNR
jgi:hypothetical protein